MTGRVGIAAEKRKISSKIEVPVTKEIKPTKIPRIETEFAPYDNAFYDIPMDRNENKITYDEEAKPHFTSSATSVDEKDIGFGFRLQDVNPDSIKQEEQEMDESDDNSCQSKPERNEDNGDEVMVVKELKGTGPAKKQRNLKFSEYEKDIIQNGEMLIDESINIAQNLLKEQFPHFAGLYDTLLGKTQEFDVIPSDQPFIQILHVGSLHWVCAGNTECTSDNNQLHFLYDSLSGKNVSLDVAKQVSAYSFCRADELYIETQEVQQQRNVVYFQSLLPQVWHSETIQRSSHTMRACYVVTS